MFSSIGKNLADVKLSNQMSVIDTLMVENRRLLCSTKNEQETVYQLLNSKKPIIIKSYKLPDTSVLHFISCNKKIKWENLKKVLTQREQEIVYWICEGEKPNDIAEHLFISPHTVQQHLKNIYKKAKVKSRTELVSLIMELRIR